MTFPLYCRLDRDFSDHEDFRRGYMMREYDGPRSWHDHVCVDADIHSWAMWDLGWRAAAYDITGRAALS